jgi:hypothetical protein
MFKKVCHKGFEVRNIIELLKRRVEFLATDPEV